METKRMITRVSLAVLTGGLFCFCAASGRAEDLTFTNTPVGNVIAQMSRQYGVTVVLRSAVNVNQPISFSVQDADGPAGRLEAINDLANALGMDFQKVYVVSKVDTAATVPDVKVDSNAYVVFPSTKIAAREAIQTVASVDNAISQISGAITGDVLLPSRRMSASSAANLIAKQTGTGWKAYYGMFKRGQGPARLEGTVVGRTNGGQAMTVLPLLTFGTTGSTPAPISSFGTAQLNGQNPVSGLNVTTVPNDSAVTYPDFGSFGYNPFGYGSPYGYINPYSSPFGSVYTTAGSGSATLGTVSTSGTVSTLGSGVTPTAPGVNSPTGTIAPGTGAVTAPTVGTTTIR